MPWQRTIASEIRMDGTSVHSGTATSVVVGPAPADSGLVFRSATSGEEIRALVTNALPGRPYQTVLAGKSFEVGTIEHLMAAISACEIDNAVVTVLGDELPIMDGSSRPWFDSIVSAGIADQDEPSRRIRILDTIGVRDGRAWCQLEPSRPGSCGFRASYSMSYPHPSIGDQLVTFDLDSETFGRELADARTFGFIDDLPRMRELGLAAGASVLNTVVFSPTGLVNHDGLRWPDEPARHKLVDAIGDLHLVGHRIIGGFHGHRSGHSLNQALARKLLSSQGSWCFE